MIIPDEVEEGRDGVRHLLEERHTSGELSNNKLYYKTKFRMYTVITNNKCIIIN